MSPACVSARRDSLLGWGVAALIAAIGGLNVAVTVASLLRL
ncbi:hypothetical protein [Alsobacter sp. R-9]